MTKTLDSFEDGIKFGEHIINNLHFADDVDLVTENENDLRNLTHRLDNVAKEFGMEISAKTSKIMITSRNRKLFDHSIIIFGQTLEQVESLKYLRSLVTEGSTCAKEIKSRLSTATVALVKLNSICKIRRRKLV